MMLKLFFILAAFILGCGPSKTPQATERNDSLSLPVSKETAGEGNLPPCIKSKIDSFKIAQKHEQPQRVVEYEYKGKKVYYVVKPCCDFFNEVYDDHCKLMGAPDGGFTGKGDGTLPDFFKTATNEKLIWEQPK